MNARDVLALCSHKIITLQFHESPQNSAFKSWTANRLIFWIITIYLGDHCASWISNTLTFSEFSSNEKNSFIVSCFCNWNFVLDLLLQNVKHIDSFALERATKKAHLSSSGCFLKFQNAESSSPIKYTAEYYTYL